MITCSLNVWFWASSESLSSSNCYKLCIPCFISICYYSWLSWVKSLPQILHKMIPWACFLCLYKRASLGNTALQIVQFFLCFNCWCCSKLSWLTNSRTHGMQTKGCFNLICLCKLCFVLNLVDMTQKLHLWQCAVSMCFSRFSLLLNTKSQ